MKYPEEAFLVLARNRLNCRSSRAFGKLIAMQKPLENHKEDRQCIEYTNSCRQSRECSEQEFEPDDEG
jgi:hypothetical protein